MEITNNGSFVTFNEDVYNMDLSSIDFFEDGIDF